MTDGGHVPGEGLPEHLHAGPDPLGGPEGVAGVAPQHGVATAGGSIPHPAAPHGGLPQGGVIPQQGQQGFTVPAPGLPGDGWAVDQGAPRPAFHFLDQPDGLDEEEDVLLMPGPQGSWGEPAVAAPLDQAAHAPQPEGTPVEPSWPPVDPPVLGAEHGQQPVQAVPVQPQAPQPVTPVQAPRRPLHAGPPIPDPSMMTGQVPVRSLADRGPSQGGTPAHGIPVVGRSPMGEAVAPAPAPQPVGVPQVTFVAPVMPAAPAAPVAPVAPVVEQQPYEQVPLVPQVSQPVEGVLTVETVGAIEVVEVVETPEAVLPQVSPVAEPVQAPVEQAAVVEPVAEPVVVEPASVETVAVETVAVETVVVEAPVGQAVEQTVEQIAEQAAAPAGQPRRISAFLAAPTSHGLPKVEAAEQAPVAEAVVEQAAPIAAADAPQAVEVAEVVEAAVVVAPAETVEAPVVVEPVAPVEVAAVVEVVEQPAPVEAPQAEAVEQPVAVVVEAVVTEAVTEAAVEPVAETAAGTGEMPSGQAVAEPAEAAGPVEVVEATQVPEAVEAVEAAAEAQPVEQPEPVALAAQPQPVAEEPQADQAEQIEQAEQAEQPVEQPEPAAEQTPEQPVEATEPTEPTEPAAPEAVQEDTPAATDEQPAEPAEPRGPAAPGYDEAGRDAVHQVIRERRDIRNGFRPDPIPHEVLIRVLEAAHTAPSVGYSQPWDFVVIRSAKTRRRMHALAERQREAYADSLPKGRAKQFKEIKIEAILDTPVNIVVTADRTRGGRHTLGRHTQPQMAPYSAALAVENLWLAARAEGLGVGWVSFFDDEELVRELGLPEHLEVVAYLCVGFVDEFPDEPELEQQGWAKKRPLSWVVHEEQYGNRALPGEEPQNLLAETLRGIRPLDAKALGEAWDRQKRMTKPAGSLGMLEIISAQLCGLSRKCPPPIPEPACVAIFAGDHGVHAQGVSPWPQEVTAQMVANFLAGGAVINSFAKQIGTEVCVVDVGVAAELPEAVQQGRATGLLPRKVKPGTDDMTQGPAMTREEALQAIEVGIETARDLVAAGNKALVTGDMGIANTTASAALISVFTGLDPAEVTGRGTGIDDETHARKIEVIRAALALHQPDPADPIGVLAAVGGLEHAAIAGFLLGAASLRTPVVLDGVIAGSAALAAKAIAPEVLAACIAGHRSAEPGHQAALAKLGLRPLIDLDLRLGEGTGALLALPLVQSAARAMHDVATFDSAGVTEKA
ncbi:nicotinate-nucleotide--dimethylbenzimidazole phosphoribosyltransferase [Kitasatospora sp. NPDC101183]|uniref:nicotinate-nucleotide--dimethylbenzimidazole phosphoribosyltransferase n=1 Tax=Kitasatospora sp. NPDC101183 TaxID=3364100 RepID=UPI00380646E9